MLWFFAASNTLSPLFFSFLAKSTAMLNKQAYNFLFIVHDGSQSTFSRVFEADQTDLNLAEETDPASIFLKSSPSSTQNGGSSASQGRFPVNVGITGYVATTGETVNIADAHSDPR